VFAGARDIGASCCALRPIWAAAEHTARAGDVLAGEVAELELAGRDDVLGDVEQRVRSIECDVVAGRIDRRYRGGPCSHEQECGA
jgi:hypothetical protein